MKHKIKEPEKYRIIRYHNCDVVERLWKGSTIYSSDGAGGCGSGHYTDIPTQWRVLNPYKHRIKIAEAQNDSRVPIILTRDYYKYLNECERVWKKRLAIVSKLEGLPEKGFLNKVREFFLRQQLKHLKWLPNPDEYLSNLPKYTVKHDVI
jgi:hypothetical protein